MIPPTREQAIDVSAIRAGLRDLKSKNPHAPEHMIAFGAALASYMNNRIYPSALRLAVDLLVSDLARGRSGYSSVVIPEMLIGLPRGAYIAMEFSVPSLLRLAAGNDHAEAAEALVRGLGDDA